MTISKIETKINRILKKTRPYVQMHGGDVVLKNVNGDEVTLEITGACAHCSMADLTYNKIIGGLIKSEVPEVREINLLFNDKK